MAPTVAEERWEREIGACAVYTVGMLAAAGVRWIRASCTTIEVDDPSGDAQWIARGLHLEVRAVIPQAFAPRALGAAYVGPALVTVPVPPELPVPDRQGG